MKRRTSGVWLKGIITAIVGALLLSVCGCVSSPDSEDVSHRYDVSKEKQLIVYTSHKEEVYLPIIEEFENRTGIWVEIHAGGTADMFNAAKEASKHGACDIMFGGGIESFEASKDLFLPYEVKEKDKLDSRYLSEGDYWTPFTELPLVFIYNNKLLQASDAPTSWKDFLDPKWKGQIAFADLHDSGTSYTILSALSQVGGDESTVFLSSFIGQLDGKILSSSRQLIPNVSDGTFLVSITLEETALKGINAGYDISMVYPSDGTVALPDGCAMVKNAPHSYNAGLFIDFVTGYDTQNYAIEKFSRRTIRTDIILPEGYEHPVLMDFDLERSAKEEQGVFNLWDSIIKEGAE